MVDQNKESAIEDAARALMGLRRMDGISGVRNGDGSTNHEVENQAFADEKALVEQKLKAVTQKYNLTEREQEAYLMTLELDARAKIDNSYGDRPQSTDNEKKFLEEMDKSPTRADRAKDEENSRKFFSDAGLSLTPDPELHGESKKPQAQRDNTPQHNSQKEKNSEEQQLLKAAGYGDILARHGEANAGVDGVRGRDTLAAEKKFREDHHLAANVDINAALKNVELPQIALNHAEGTSVPTSGAKPRSVDFTPPH